MLGRREDPIAIEENYTDAYLLVFLLVEFHPGTLRRVDELMVSADTFSFGTP